MAAAAPNQREVFDTRVTTSEGHYARWRITQRDLHLLREWPFFRRYRTLCEFNPTNWEFLLEANEVRVDGSATLSFRLTRRDSLGVHMESSVWVDVTDPNEEDVFPRQSFTRQQMVEREEMTHTFDLQPYAFMAHAVDEKIIIIVTVTVANCHEFVFDIGR